MEYYKLDDLIAAMHEYCGSIIGLLKPVTQVRTWGPAVGSGGCGESLARLSAARKEGSASGRGPGASTSTTSLCEAPA